MLAADAMADLALAELAALVVAAAGQRKPLGRCVANTACFRPGLIFACSFSAILSADFSVKELRFVSDGVLTQDLKLLGRTWDQVRLFYESVEDLRHERLAGVIAVDPGYRNIGFAK